MLTGRVITVSDRCAGGSGVDRSGPLAVDLLRGHGLAVDFPELVPDDRDRIAERVSRAVADGVDVVVLTGGTGIGPRDVTPEAVGGLLERTLPGVGEAIRASSRGTVATADLSRIVAGTVGNTFVLALPGSTGGVRDGLTVAGPLLGHATAMLRGDGHAEPDPGTASGPGTATGPNTTADPSTTSSSGTSGDPSTTADLTTATDLPTEPAGAAEPAPISTKGEPMDPAVAVSATPAGTTGPVPAPVCERVALCEVTEEPLDQGWCESLVSGPGSGAVVSFAGVVRDHDRGRYVAHLEYQGHPSAKRVLTRLVNQVVAQSPEVSKVAVTHRTGQLTIGEPALVVAVAAAHRSEAFTACSRLVDEIKHGLPMWKRQVFTDGSDEWVNCA